MRCAMDEIEQSTSAEATSLNSANGVSDHAFPELVIRALWTALVDCQPMQFDQTTGTFISSEPHSQRTKLGDTGN